jgi:hypothetical protein
MGVHCLSALLFIVVIGANTSHKSAIIADK